MSTHRLDDYWTAVGYVVNHDPSAYEGFFNLYKDINNLPQYLGEVVTKADSQAISYIQSRQKEGLGELIKIYNDTRDAIYSLDADNASYINANELKAIAVLNSLMEGWVMVMGLLGHTIDPEVIKSQLVGQED